jgi:Mg2+ and Co2+ transporter CorA
VPVADLSEVRKEPETLIWVDVVSPTEAAPHARPHEVDLVSGRNFLLSFHRGRPVDADAVAARVRAHPDLVDEGGGFLLYVVLDELVDAFFPALDRIGERVEDLQEAVFQGRTQVQADLFGLRKDMVKVRRIAGPMLDANLTVISNKVAEVARALGAYAAIFAVVTMIAGIWHELRPHARAAMALRLRLSARAHGRVRRRPVVLLQAQELAIGA